MEGSRVGRKEGTKKEKGGTEKWRREEGNRIRTKTGSRSEKKERWREGRKKDGMMEGREEGRKEGRKEGKEGQEGREGKGESKGKELLCLWHCCYILIFTLFTFILMHFFIIFCSIIIPHIRHNVFMSVHQRVINFYLQFRKNKSLIFSKWNNQRQIPHKMTVILRHWGHWRQSKFFCKILKRWKKLNVEHKILLHYISVLIWLQS